MLHHTDQDGCSSFSHHSCILGIRSEDAVTPAFKDNSPKGHTALMSASDLQKNSYSTTAGHKGMRIKSTHTLSLDNGSGNHTLLTMLTWFSYSIVFISFFFFCSLRTPRTNGLIVSIGTFLKTLQFFSGKHQETNCPLRFFGSFSLKLSPFLYFFTPFF